ncbi:MAG: hypothetical protein ABIR46_02575, partial [Candidatus Saccharimonadales bacterium]
MKKLITGFVLVALSVALPLSTVSNSVGAVSGSEWRAGRIIDDGVFTNATDMSVGEIQAFLNARVPVCDNWGTKPSEFGGGTRAQYAASRGYSTPFTCLKEYYEVPKTTPGPAEPASNYGGAPIPPGAQSAAHIISNAATKYNISPKALLVKLATESPGPLTSDDWPFKKQYLYAMGAHCPDSGPGGSANCDANWSGFSLQMDEAAALLRWYLDSMTQPWWQYKKPYQNNSILWNVAETGCGAGNVYIETKATAALYTYTPYQPNQAALNNMYGTGDGCSAYGNRNFWRVWYDWFGSPQSPSYVWQATSQYAYTDSSKTTPIGLDNLNEGQRVFIGFTAKNLGSSTWTNSGTNPIRVGTSRPESRTSSFFDPSWLGYGRPSTLKEASVAPGETGTFEFWITAPQVGQASSYNEYFTLLAEGKAWMPDIGLRYAINVKPFRYTWDLVSQYAYTDEAKTIGTGLFGMEPGQRKYIGLVVRNTGNVTWSNSGTNPLKLGTSRGLDRSSSLEDISWLSASRPALMKETTVAPGQTATFEFWIKASDSKYGSFAEYFNPVLEGRAWLNDIGLNYSGSVITPRYSWQLMSQYAHSDAARTQAIGLSNLAPGQVVYVGFTAKNTGNTTWQNEGSAFPIRIGTSNPNDRISLFCGPGWLTCSRPASLK